MSPHPAPRSRSRVPHARLRAVCVYCGSSSRGPRRHQAAATRFGRLLAESGIELVYGGGHVGLMGLMADAALAAGGRVTGVIPADLIRKEVGYGKVTRLVITRSMHARKMSMFRRSDAFVVLPGGPGTLDELFEVLTWRQLGFHDKPIVLVDDGGYWRPLLRLIDRVIAQGYARPGFRRLYRVVASVEAVLPALRAAHRPRVRARPKGL